MVKKTFTCCIQRIHSKPLDNSIFAMCYSTQRRQQVDPELEHGRLHGKHFPIKVSSSKNQTKRKYPTKCCKIRDFTQQQRHHYMHIGPSLPTKYTTFTCNKCRDIPMCVTPCFKIFHTEFIKENVLCNTIFATTYRHM